LPVVLPPIQEQRTIAESMQSLVDLHESKRTKKKRLLGLKKSLMQDLLTGKVRVSVN
jgi:type I restriction enzyme S subunit